MSNVNVASSKMCWVDNASAYVRCSALSSNGVTNSPNAKGPLYTTHLKYISVSSLIASGWKACIFITLSNYLTPMFVNSMVKVFPHPVGYGHTGNKNGSLLSSIVKLKLGNNQK